MNRVNRMKALIGNERGSMLIALTGIVTVFLLLTALLVDFGRVWLHSSHLQVAADAAVLAGAGAVSVRVEIDRDGNIYSHEIILDPTISRTEALAVLNKNIEVMGLKDLGVVITDKDVTVSGLQVTVAVKGTAPMYLLPMMGEFHATLPIARAATAELAP